ncbi:MAG: radical SAM protein [Desulfuromonadales bacterium]|nr:radical SAM protein [Desulfuromonadales bacterium]
MRRRAIYPIFLPHAGCLHRCIFCAQVLTSACTTPPDPASTLAAISASLPPGGNGELAFYGGSFTLLAELEQERWLEVGARLLAAGQISALRISTRPDAVTPAIARRLAAAGVATVELGCQSFDPEVLRRAGRGHSAAAAAQALPLLRAEGIAVGLHLMPGLPGADAGEALHSLQVALALQPDFLRIHPTIVLRGTALAKLYESGEYTPLSLSAAVQLGATMLRRARAANIPIIRFGLMANENLDRGTAVVDGPYHPAFGQLIRSRLWFERISLLAERGGRSFRLHPADLADVFGQRRSNFIELNSRYGPLTYECSETLPRETIESAGVFYSLFSEKD